MSARPTLSDLLMIGVATLVATPIGVIVYHVLTPSADVWRHLWETRLFDYVSNTVLLVAGVGLGTSLLGTALAWLVVAYRFPGREVLEWMLVLPLAMPAYVIAFVMAHLFSYAGPVQSLIRAGWGTSDWVPEIRTMGGAILVMTLVLYPYVYLLARAAFGQQPTRLVEAARTMGYTARQAFLRVVLPLARPSLIVGTALALMEALADIGAVHVFNVPTLTVGVYRVWYGLQDRVAAMEVAGLLLLLAVAGLIAERSSRGRARFAPIGGTALSHAARPLSGVSAWLACAVGFGVVGLGFFLPVAQLLVWAVQELRAGGLDARYLEFTAASLSLAAGTAAVAIGLALVLGYARRTQSSPLVRLSIRMASMGYAIPGAVVAMGALAPLAAFETMLFHIIRATSGVEPRLLVLGTGLALGYVYLVRFLAAAYYPVEAGLEKITASMDMAARNLGLSRFATLARIHLPLLRAGLLAGMLLVFVDVMKEQPATLLLRPMGTETLATRVWQMTSESLWSQAALPALTIVLAGLAPVAVLVRLGRPPSSRRVPGPAAGGSGT